MWLPPKISVFHFLPRSSIFQRMVLADLGRKLTTALRSLGNSPVINEEVLERKSIFSSFFWNIMIFCRKNIKLSQRGMPCANGGRCEHQAGETIERWCKRFETCNKLQFWTSKILTITFSGQIDLEEMGSGLNKRRVIQTAVYKELVKICDPKVEAWKPKKVQQNWILISTLFRAKQMLSCLSVSKVPVKRHRVQNWRITTRRRYLSVKRIVPKSFRAGNRASSVPIHFELVLLTIWNKTRRRPVFPFTVLTQSPIRPLLPMKVWKSSKKKASTLLSLILRVDTSKKRHFSRKCYKSIML